MGLKDAIDPQKAARIYVGGVIADCFLEYEDLHLSFYEQRLPFEVWI